LRIAGRDLTETGAQITIWVCVTIATSLPSSRVTRVCHTELRRPMWSGVDSARIGSPFFGALI
jgi:hypothetical protein